jgi:hypothetical protein
LRLGYAPTEAIGASAQPVPKKSKSKGKLLQAATRGGVAGGKRAPLRADKPRRAGGGDMQVEPLPPPSWNIPGTDIPDRSQSEEASIGTTHHDTDLNLPNAYDTSPNRHMDLAGEPPVDQKRYPGIVNPPAPGSQNSRRITRLRR